MRVMACLEEAWVGAVMSIIVNATLQNLHELERLDKSQDERRRLEALRLLDREAKARKQRIALRREQRAKAEAAARRMRRMRRMRAFKLSGVWAFAISGVFITATWFSNDFIVWLDSLRHAF